LTDKTDYCFTACA